MTNKTLSMALVLSAAASILSAAQQPAASSALLKTLQSSDPLERLRAFESVKAALNSPAASRVLIDLVDRENKLMDATLAPGAKSVGERYGEGYGEYYAELFDLCDLYCDKGDLQTLEILTAGAYDPESQFARKLAREHGTRILPFVVAQATENTPRRAEGLMMLSTIMQSNHELSRRDSSTIRSTVIAAVNHRSSVVRQAGIYALGNIGTSSDLPLLSRIAEKDSYHVIQDGKTVYPVREAAKQASPKVKLRTPPVLNPR